MPQAVHDCKPSFVLDAAYAGQVNLNNAEGVGNEVGAVEENAHVVAPEDEISPSGHGKQEDRKIPPDEEYVPEGHKRQITLLEEK